jgi:hypothetical protein
VSVGKVVETDGVDVKKKNLPHAQKTAYAAIPVAKTVRTL